MPRYQYPFELWGFNKMVEDGLDVKDIEVKDLLLMILMEMRVLNTHIGVLTDEEINIDEEVEV